MKYTIKKFILSVQEIEVEAANKVDDFFTFPELDFKKVQRQNKKYLKAIKPQIKESYKEGVKFGKHIKKLADRAKLSK